MSLTDIIPHEQASIPRNYFDASKYQYLGVTFRVWQPTETSHDSSRHLWYKEHVRKTGILFHASGTGSGIEKAID